MSKRFEPWGTTEIIQDKRYIWNLERICDYLNENFDKITDLEAKLAESEFRYENLHNLYYKDTEELKQQLVEKDKKQERTNKVVEQFQQRVKYFSEQANQDKIELLEKVVAIAKEIKGLDWCNQLCEKVGALIKEIKGTQQ